MDFRSSTATLQLCIIILSTGLCCWPLMELESALLFPNRDDGKATFSHSDGSEDASLSRTRHFWELVSSSSDSIPLENRTSPESPQPVHISLETRLSKLEHHFNTLRIYDEDCRQRLLCNLAENPKKFAPLSNSLLDETSYVGDAKDLAAALLSTNQGARLLSYIEAVQKGSSRLGCDVWTYRCPLSINAMIDYKALLVWKELSKWLTVKFVANKRS